MMNIIYKENKYFFNTNYNYLTYKEKYNILREINSEYNTDSNYLMKKLIFFRYKKISFPSIYQCIYIIEMYDFEYNNNKKFRKLFINIK